MRFFIDAAAWYTDEHGEEIDSVDTPCVVEAESRDKAIMIAHAKCRIAALALNSEAFSYSLVLNVKPLSDNEDFSKSALEAWMDEDPNHRYEFEENRLPF